MGPRIARPEGYDRWPAANVAALPEAFRVLRDDWHRGVAMIETQHPVRGDARVWAWVMHFATTAEQRSEAFERSMAGLALEPDDFRRASVLPWTVSAALQGGEDGMARRAIGVFDAAVARLESEASGAIVLEGMFQAVFYELPDERERVGHAMARLAHEQMHWRARRCLRTPLDITANLCPGELEGLVAAIPSERVRAWARARCAVPRPGSGPRQFFW